VRLTQQKQWSEPMTIRKPGKGKNCISLKAKPVGTRMYNEDGKKMTTPPTTNYLLDKELISSCQIRDEDAKLQWQVCPLDHRARRGKGEFQIHETGRSMGLWM
jgi:hypothetical protein